MAIYDYPICVSESAIDLLGHVNNLQYLAWMIDAAVAHSADRGWPPKRYLEFGAGWVVRSHQIEYFAPAFANDQLVVSTWIASFYKIRCVRKYRIIRKSDDRQIAHGETIWTFFSFDRQVPIRIPEEVSRCFEVSDPE